MKIDKLKGKNIILLLVVLAASCFGGFKIMQEYGPTGNMHAEELKGSSITTDYQVLKAECVEKAVRWLSNLAVDPIELDKRGMKGKKHFVEKLFTYYLLYTHTADLKKKALYRTILKKMVKMTENADYHLIGKDESSIKSNITSYVHACYLIEQLGFDVHEYKRHIRELLPRIERHMQSRNASVQMMLIYYLQGLGFDTEYTIKGVLKKTLIYNLRKLGDINILEFKYNSYMLGVCHEIFVLSGYGSKHIDLLTGEEKEYLKDAITSSIEQILSSGDIRYLDLLAELLVSLKYLNCDKLPEYEDGIRFILSHQNENGTFGDFEKFRTYYATQGVDIDIKWYLHTTEVCLWALLTESSLVR